MQQQQHQEQELKNQQESEQFLLHQEQQKQQQQQHSQEELPRVASSSSSSPCAAADSEPCGADCFICEISAGEQGDFGEEEEADSGVTRFPNRNKTTSLRPSIPRSPRSNSSRGNNSISTMNGIDRSNSSENFNSPGHSHEKNTIGENQHRWELDEEEERMLLLSAPQPPTQKAKWIPKIWWRWAWRALRDILCLVGLFVFISSRIYGVSIPNLALWLPLMWVAIVWRTIRSVVHSIIGLFIIPSQLLYYKGPLLAILPRAYRQMLDGNTEALLQQRQMRCEEPGVAAFGVPAADGGSVDVIHYRGRGRVDGPTIIRFNGNGEAHEFFDGQDLHVYLQLGLNVVTFNYRGVGKSAWKGSSLLSWLFTTRVDLRDGIVLDGDAVVQYVHESLHVEIDKIILLGHSLGGAVATEVALNHPGVVVCNSRSFGSLSNVVRVLAAEVLGISPRSMRGRILNFLAPMVTRGFGWEFSSADKWGQLSGFKWLEHSPADGLIRPQLSLVAALRGWGGIPGKRLNNNNNNNDNNNEGDVEMDIESGMSDNRADGAGGRGRMRGETLGVELSEVMRTEDALPAATVAPLAMHHNGKSSPLAGSPSEASLGNNTEGESDPFLKANNNTSSLSPHHLDRMVLKDDSLRIVTLRSLKGFDNHNRCYTPREMRQHVTMVMHSIGQNVSFSVFEAVGIGSDEVDDDLEEETDSYTGYDRRSDERWEGVV